MTIADDGSLSPDELDGVVGGAVHIDSLDTKVETGGGGDDTKVMEAVAKVVKEVASGGSSGRKRG
jgi:hypothetical protein